MNLTQACIPQYALNGTAAQKHGFPALPGIDDYIHMRAARAAKEYRQATDGLVNLLQTCVDSSHSSIVDYVLQSLFPLLAEVIRELCRTRPTNPSVSLLFWLLQQCNAPEKAVRELREWSSSGTVVNPVFADKGSTAALCHRGVDVQNRNVDGDLVPRPPSTRRSRMDNSISPRARIASRSGTGPEELSKRRVSLAIKPCTMWQDVDDATDGDESPVDEQQDECKYNSTVMRLGGPRHSGCQRKSVLAERRRRFTVSLASEDVPLPEDGEIIQLLQTVPTFKNYSEKDMMRIKGIVKCKRFDHDEIVSNFGTVAAGAHIILDGTGKVSVPHLIGSIKKGDCFGEEVLRHTAALSPVQVAALGGPLTTLFIPCADFEKLDINRHCIERNPDERTARKAVSDTVDGMSPRDAGNDSICAVTGREIVKDFEKTKADQDMIRMAVLNNKMLGEVLHLDEDQIAMIADSVYLIKFEGNATLMKKGDPGTALFIIQEGMLDVHLDEGMRADFKLRAGDSFGELALLYQTPRMATITSARDCKLWVLTRHDFRAVVRLSCNSRVAVYSKLLSNIPALTRIVEEPHLDMVAGILEEISFLEGEEVCSIGEDTGLLFVVLEGECQVVTEDGEDDGPILRRGDYVGEEQVINSLPSTQTVKVISESATILALDDGSLNVVLKALSELKKSNLHRLSSTLSDTERRISLTGASPPPDHLGKENFTANYLKRRLVRQSRRSSTIMEKHKTSSARKSVCERLLCNDEDEEYALHRFCKVGALGEGAFGSVLLMRDTKTQRTFAVKGLCKAHIQKEKMAERVANERAVMMLLDSDFIVRLYRTFQDSNHIFFVVEPVLGGELFDVYTEKNLWGKLPLAKFYIACVTLALQHMHIRRIIYRDLKLENCLLDMTGYLKLTDMGIAKMVIGKTYTICGTADYFAPETLKQIGHNRAADWWACAVLLFIMCAGRSPFDAPDVTQIYKNIVKGFSKVQFPKTFPSDLTDVVKSLGRKKPEERVTMQKGGVENLKCMPFFSSFDWVGLEQRKIPAPFIPPQMDDQKIADKKLGKEFLICREAVQEWSGGTACLAPEDHNDDSQSKDISSPKGGRSLQKKFASKRSTSNLQSDKVFDESTAT